MAGGDTQTLVAGNSFKLYATSDSRDAKKTFSIPSAT